MTFGLILGVALFILLKSQLVINHNFAIFSFTFAVFGLILMILEDQNKLKRRKFVDKEFSKVTGLFKNVVDEAYIEKNDLIIPLKNVDFDKAKNGNIIISMKEVKEFFTK